MVVIVCYAANMYWPFIINSTHFKITQLLQNTEFECTQLIVSAYKQCDFMVSNLDTVT